MITRVTLLGAEFVPPGLMGIRKSTLAFFLVLFFAAAQMGSAQAITNGNPDDGASPVYPYVAGVVDPSNELFCSGVAISPRLLLTSGHCFITPGQYVWVSFGFDVSPSPDFPNGWQIGTWHPHPEFCLLCSPAQTDFDTHDIAVVVLEEEADLASYARLPEEEHFVETLPQRTVLTLVGYGLQWDTPTGNFHRWEGVWTRHYAPAEIIPSEHVNSDEFIALSQNPARGKGGDCRGDSGGPNLLGNIVVGLTAYGNLACTGVGYSQRIDLEYVLEFIRSFSDD